MTYWSLFYWPYDGGLQCGKELSLIPQVSAWQRISTLDSSTRRSLRVSQVGLLLSSQSPSRYCTLSLSITDYMPWMWDLQIKWTFIEQFDFKSKSKNSVKSVVPTCQLFSHVQCQCLMGLLRSECTLSVQGMGGATQYPKNYLKEAYKLVRERGGICIADEVRRLASIILV